MQKQTAFLFAKIDLNSEQEVLEHLQGLEGVDYAVLLFGKPDLLAMVSAQDVEDLYRNVLAKVQKVPGLQLTKTFVCKPGRD